MINNPACPVCSGRSLDFIGSQSFKRDQRGLDEYVTRRFGVLFEIWFPSAQEVQFKTALCRTCGFIFHAPRVTIEDVDAKYRFLASHPDEPEAVPSRTSKRANRLFGKVWPFLRDRKDLTVLDFGGGDGRLMQRFVEAGARVDLIDYGTATTAGVRRIGDTEASLQPGVEYDAIISSHVIEHVPNPVEILTSLTRHLKSDGVLYVEVPMEVWGGAPHLREPVTHVNFFTPGSMRHLIRRTGGDVVSCGLDGHPHESGYAQLVVTAVVRRSDSRPEQFDDPIDTPRYLAPTLGTRIHRRLLMPSTIFEALRYKLTAAGR